MIHPGTFSISCCAGYCGFRSWILNYRPPITPWINLTCQTQTVSSPWHVISENTQHVLSVRASSSNERPHLSTYKLVVVQHALPNPSLSKASVLDGMVPLSPVGPHTPKGVFHKLLLFYKLFNCYIFLYYFYTYCNILPANDERINHCRSPLMLCYEWTEVEVEY